MFFILQNTKDDICNVPKVFVLATNMKYKFVTQSITQSFYFVWTLNWNVLFCLAEIIYFSTEISKFAFLILFNAEPNAVPLQLSLMGVSRTPCWCLICSCCLTLAGILWKQFYSIMIQPICMFNFVNIPGTFCPVLITYAQVQYLFLTFSICNSQHF